MFSRVISVSVIYQSIGSKYSFVYLVVTMPGNFFSTGPVLANKFEENVMVPRNLTYLLLDWFCQQMHFRSSLIIRFHRYSPVGDLHWLDKRANRLETSALQSCYHG